MEADEANLISSVDANNKISRNEIKNKIFLLEPCVFLIFFSIDLSGTVYQTNLIQQTCANVFEFNISDCNKLGIETIESDRSKEINAKIQPYVASILMVKSILESVLPAIMSLFLGPWSDKFGRKPVILVGSIGLFASLCLLSVINIICKIYPVNTWFYLISCLPVALLGGISCLISAVYCFVADSRKNNLAFRMVVTEASLFLGSMVGSLTSSYLLKYSSPFYVFVISALSVLIAILYVHFCIDENSNENIIGKFRQLFDFSLVKEMFFTCIKVRSNYKRTIILLTMSSLIIAIFIMGGESTVMYLFVIEKFNWTIKDYTIYNTIAIANLVFGNVIAVVILQKLLKFSLVSLTLLSLGSAVLDTVTKATASYSWEIYLSMGLGMLRGMASPMKRSILSSVAPQNELGKIMSLTVSLESLSTLASAPLYTYIYTRTMQTYAGAFNFISAGLFLISYIFIAIIFSILKSEPESAYSKIT